MEEATRLRVTRYHPQPARRQARVPGRPHPRRENASDLLHARFSIPAQPTSRGQDLPNSGPTLRPSPPCVFRQQRGERGYGSLRIDQQHKKLLAHELLELRQRQGRHILLWASLIRRTASNPRSSTDARGSPT